MLGDTAAAVLGGSANVGTATLAIHFKECRCTFGDVQTRSAACFTLGGVMAQHGPWTGLAPAATVESWQILRWGKYRRCFAKPQYWPRRLRIKHIHNTQC